MVFADTMDSFNNYILPDSVLVVLDNCPAMEILSAISGVTSTEPLDDQRVRLHFKGAANITKDIVALSVRHGWELKEIMLEKSSLDETFARLSNNNR